MNDSSNTKAAKPRQSKLANASFWIIFLSIPCCLFAVFLPEWLSDIWFKFFFIAWIIGIICGLVSLLKISLSRGRLKGGARASIAVFFPFIIIALLIMYASRRQIGGDYDKWHEAKANAGTISTALRAYAAENVQGGNYPPTISELGLTKDDLKSTYFTHENYSISASYDPNLNPPLRYTITVTAPKRIGNAKKATLDHNGNWNQYP